jgi:hypothetical protein
VVLEQVAQAKASPVPDVIEGIRRQVDQRAGDRAGWVGREAQRLRDGEPHFVHGVRRVLDQDAEGTVIVSMAETRDDLYHQQGVGLVRQHHQQFGHALGTSLGMSVHRVGQLSRPDQLRPDIVHGPSPREVDTRI